VAWAEAYLRAKFHLDPSSRLTTIHQRYTDRQTERSDSICEPFYKRSPKKKLFTVTFYAAVKVRTEPVRSLRRIR